MHDRQRGHSDTESADNPYQAPTAIEPAGETTEQAVSVTRLARWLIGGGVFEVILAMITLVPNDWPRFFSIAAVPLACLAINVIVLAVAGWQIGRWHRFSAAVCLSQIVHIACWLIYILAVWVLTGWSLGQGDWAILRNFACGSAILNAVTSGFGSCFGITKMGFLVRAD